MRDIVKNNVAFWLTLTISIVLIVASFIVPPTGIIDPSVLAAIGELFGFASLGVVLRAIEKGVDARVKKGDTTVEIGDLNKKDETDY